MRTRQATGDQLAPWLNARCPPSPASTLQARPRGPSHWSMGAAAFEHSCADEGVATDHDRRGPVTLQAAHGPQPGLEPSVVALDAIVREALRVVAGVGEQLVDRSDQRRRLVRHHLSRSAMVPQRDLEEPSSGRQVPAAGQVHVDDLAELVDRPVHVAPDAGDLDVGLVHEPAVPDRVAARPCRVDQERREALHPPPPRSANATDPLASALQSRVSDASTTAESLVWRALPRMGNPAHTPT